MNKTKINKRIFRNKNIIKDLAIVTQISLGNLNNYSQLRLMASSAQIIIFIKLLINSARLYTHTHTHTYYWILFPVKSRVGEPETRGIGKS